MKNKLRSRRGALYTARYDAPLPASPLIPSATLPPPLPPAKPVRELHFALAHEASIICPVLAPCAHGARSMTPHAPQRPTYRHDSSLTEAVDGAEYQYIRNNMYGSDIIMMQHHNICSAVSQCDHGPRHPNLHSSLPRHHRHHRGRPTRPGAERARETPRHEDESGGAVCEEVELGEGG